MFEYRANLGFNYTRGRHNFNWATRWTSAITVDNGSSLATATSATNANTATPGEEANVVDGSDAYCVSAAALTNSENGSIPGAGQGEWGVYSGGRIGYCAANNVSITGGTTQLPASFYSDFSYRVTLPWETSLTATVQNIFDRDPGFKRVSDAYDSYLESPTGRTIRVGFQKKF